jgi:hypothetical protein
MVLKTRLIIVFGVLMNIIGASSSEKLRVGKLLLRRRSSRRRHCLKATTTSVEERQLRLKVATKVKHDGESKKKRLVNP